MYCLHLHNIVFFLKDCFI
uniref:Uncharacterized protein n=1 Tax=Anguilla anguilla TaxID=7936 RepID=A0A0E9W1N8_ANGAN